MSLEIINLANAMASITASASGGGVVPTFALNAGFNPTGTGAAHTSTGIYDLVLDTPLLSTECVIFATVRGTTGDAACNVSHVSNTVKRVTTLVAGSVADTVSFDLMVWQKPNA